MNLRAKTAFGNSGQAPDIYCIIQGGDANENGGDDDVDEDGVEDRDDPQKAGEDGRVSLLLRGWNLGGGR